MSLNVNGGFVPVGIGGTSSSTNENEYVVSSSVSGNPIHVEDSADMPIRNLTIRGNSEQEELKGVNLFNDRVYANGTTANGVTITADITDGINTFNVTGTASATTDIHIINDGTSLQDIILRGGKFVFTLNGNANGLTPFITYTAPDGATGCVYADGAEYTIPEYSMSGSVYIHVISGQTYNVSGLSLMLVLSDDYKSGMQLEAYTGSTYGKNPENRYTSSVDAIMSYPSNSSGTWVGNVYTCNGISYKIFNNGVVKATGTATLPSSLTLYEGAYDVGKYKFASNRNVADTEDCYIETFQDGVLPITTSDSFIDTSFTIPAGGTPHLTFKIMVLPGTVNTYFKPTIFTSASGESEFYKTVYKSGGYKLSSVGSDGYIDITVCGKNILEIKNTNKTIGGVTFTVNGDGTINMNNKATADIEYVLNDNILVKSGETYRLSPNQNWNGFTGYIKWGSYDTKNLITSSLSVEVTDENIEELKKVSIIIPSGANTNVEFQPQIELAIITTNPEPYKSQIVRIPVTSPLVKVGYLYDEFTKKDNKYVISRALKRFVLNGTETWGMDGDCFRMKLDIAGLGLRLMRSDVNECVLSENFRGLPYNDFVSEISSGKDNLITTTASGFTDREFLLIYKSKYTGNLADFKEYLSNNNVTVYHAAANVTEEQISSTAQSALKKLKTYKTISNISNDENAEMDCEYVVDLDVVVEEVKWNTEQLDYMEGRIQDNRTDISSLISKVNSIPVNYRIYATNAERDADADVANGTMCVVLDSTHSYTINSVKPNLDIVAVTIDTSITPDLSEDKVIVCFPNCNPTYLFMLGQFEIKDGVLYLGQASRNKPMYNGSWNASNVRQFQLFYTMLGKTGEVAESLPWLSVTVATPYMMFMYKDDVWNELTLEPVRGVDYWNDADIAEIKKYVDDAILGGEW